MGAKHLEKLLAMPPEGTDLVLPTHIPDSERDVLVLHGFDVKTLLKRKKNGYF